MSTSKASLHLEDLKRLTRHARSYLQGIKAGEVFVKGETISYLEGGEGEVVLLIHGFSSTKGLWRMQMTPLMKRFRVIAMEVPGLSLRYVMNNPNAFSLRFLTDLVEEFCLKLGLNSPHIFGTSTGSVLAANYSLKYPCRPKSLTMLGMPMLFKESDNPLHDPVQAAPFYVPTTMEGMEELTNFLYLKPPQFPEASVQRVLETMKNNREQMIVVLEEFFKGVYQVVPRLNHITVPSLFIYGDHDRVTPQRSVDVLTSTIPNVQTYCLENTGHVSYIESPNEVAALFASFVSYMNSNKVSGTPNKIA